MSKRPWDIFNDKLEKASSNMHEKRMKICMECEFFINLTKQCKKCGCFMEIKTRMDHTSCPINKWLPARFED